MTMKPADGLPSHTISVGSLNLVLTVEKIIGSTLPYRNTGGQVYRLVVTTFKDAQGFDGSVTHSEILVVEGIPSLGLILRRLDPTASY